MALFRFYKECLAESLKTTIIVNSLSDVFDAVIFSEMAANQPWKTWTARFEIKPYPLTKSGLDERTGWFTQIIMSNVYEENTMRAVGFLSEPLKE